MTYFATVYADELPSGTALIGAMCPQFDIAGQGETEEEALRDLRGGVALYLNVDEEKVDLRVESSCAHFVA